eukprot:scaffold17314_cov105-Skeletonema_dohrnii-CCMP3373.AAC.1
MLEPCERCFYAIITNCNGSLQAVDRHIHSVRYDMVLESIAAGRLRCLIRSPKRCGDVDMPNQCLSPVKDASMLS